MLKRRRVTFAVGAALALSGTTAGAQNWDGSASIGAQVTYTNNLDQSSSSDATGDLVMRITPAFRISGQGARTQLDAAVSVPILLYLDSGGENNYIAPSASLRGSVEVVQDLFFVTGTANISQRFASPFGALPSDLITPTDNRYTSQSYSLGAYVTHTAPNNVEYLVRNTIYWDVPSDAPDFLRNTYTNNFEARLSRNIQATGWSVVYTRTTDEYTDREADLTQRVRATYFYQVDPQLQLALSGGYEDNRIAVLTGDVLGNAEYTFNTYNNATYGAGFRWRPTPRTNVAGFWEHRFFGSSYGLDFSHRTPLTAWNASASRTGSSYAQYVGTLPATGNVDGLLNELYTSRYTDPAQRQQAVNQFIADQGLPTSLQGPVPIYREQFQVVESANASSGIVGVRNSIFFTLFWSRTIPFTDLEVAFPGAQPLQDSTTTQYGGEVRWGLRTASLGGFTAAVGQSWASNSVADALDNHQWYANLGWGWSKALSQRTVFGAGASLEYGQSGQADDYTEFRLYARLNHTFN